MSVHRYVPLAQFRPCAPHLVSAGGQPIEERLTASSGYQELDSSTLRSRPALAVRAAPMARRTPFCMGANRRALSQSSMMAGAADPA
jgi:hypothetical protein